MSPVPELIRPMLATPGDLPSTARDGEYGYELKWDGVRAVTYIGPGEFRMLSRNDKSIVVSYPELTGLADNVGDQVVLDGEIVAFDESGTPSFGRLQHRMHIADPVQAGRLASTVPVAYLIFDLLHLGGQDLLSLPYVARRELLDALGLRSSRWDVPPYFAGGGQDALELSRAQRLEGVVAKRLDSGYEPGRRSSNWIKVKTFRTQEIVVGGWRPGKGSRGMTLGSLLIGVPGAGGLDYVGRVGSGFTERMLAHLLQVLRPLARSTSPFTDTVPAADARDAQWVEPRLVGEVAFGHWTADGRLRHPSWRGLRPDRDPGDVERES